jgi:hypothetical protein
MNQIKSIMDEHGKHLRFDSRLVGQLERFVQNFINKSPEHVKCLGSNLTGVNRLSWSLDDRLEWEENFLQIDGRDLRQAILAIPHMDDVGRVAGDNFNISCCWLAHRFYKSDLPPRVKEKGMKLSMDILQYKLLSSIHSHYFKYPVDQNVAEATYAELSRKFDIKRYGSWRAVLDSRSENIIATGEIHEQTIRQFDDDIAIVKMIQDIQFRLRDKIKNIWEVMANVIEKDMKFGSVSSTIELDGALVTRDIERLSTEYIHFIKEAAAERDRFIKPDLVDVIESVMSTMPEKPFEQLLVIFTEKVSKSDKNALQLVELTMEHLFNVVLADRKTTMRMNDIPAVLNRIRGLYTASRSNNDILEQMKEITEKFVRKDVKIVNNANVAALRTGLLLYLVLRAMVKDHYK